MKVPALSINKNSFDSSFTFFRQSKSVFFVPLLIVLAIPAFYGVIHFLAPLIGRICKKSDPSEQESRVDSLSSPILSNNPPPECDISNIKDILPVREMTEDIEGIPLPGLNMLGICKTHNCPNKDKLAVIPQGFNCEDCESYPDGSFDISEVCSKTRCPSCKQKGLYKNINDIVLTGVICKIASVNTRGVKTDKEYSIKNTENVIVNIENFISFHITLKPLPINKIA